MTIKTILFAVLGSLGLLLLSALAIILATSSLRLHEAQMAKQSNQVTDLMLSASGVWAQERGLTNLALNASEPATPELVAHIKRLRAQADDDYERAQALLPKSRLKPDPDRRRAFDTTYARLTRLRAQADQQLQLPDEKRDVVLKKEWFPSISAVIEQSQLSAMYYTSQALSASSVVAKDAIVRHNLWLMSEYAGRERGLMAGIIASGRPITHEQMHDLAEYRAYVDEGWKIVHNLDMRPDEKAALNPAMVRVQSAFFGEYEGLRTQVLREGTTGRPYSVGAQIWFDTATSAIDTILELEMANTAYVAGRLTHQQTQQTLLLWLCAAFLLLGAAAVAGAFWLVNRHVLYSVANLKAIFETAGEGLMTIDASGEIKSFNPACERIFKTAARDAIGCNIRAFMPEPDRSAHDGYLQRYLKTGEGRIIGTSGREVVGCRRNGETFPMELLISRFELEDGIHFCGVVRDVTAARLAEKDRETLLNKLIESNTELERFAYVASHDMQEPIRMVMSFSQIIIEDYGTQLDDKGREYLHVLSDSAHRMLNMIRDLLQYARLEAEGMSWSEVDMARELVQVKINLAELIAETSADIKSDPMPRVAGNPMQLQRVLQNLIANAIRYQVPERRPQIHVSVADLGDHWCFGVSDNGVGIEAAHYKRIFEPFRRLHTQEQVKGTGFGLSIVKKIVEMHGGTVSVTSVPGEGSTFTFTLMKAGEAAGKVCD